MYSYSQYVEADTSPYHESFVLFTAQSYDEMSDGDDKPYHPLSFNEDSRHAPLLVQTPHADQVNKHIKYNPSGSPYEFLYNRPKILHKIQYHSKGYFITHSGIYMTYAVSSSMLSGGKVVYCGKSPFGDDNNTQVSGVYIESRPLKVIYISGNDVCKDLIRRHLHDKLLYHNYHYQCFGLSALIDTDKKLGHITNSTRIYYQYERESVISRIRSLF